MCEHLPFGLRLGGRFSGVLSGFLRYSHLNRQKVFLYINTHRRDLFSFTILYANSDFVLAPAQSPSRWMRYKRLEWDELNITEEKQTLASSRRFLTDICISASYFLPSSPVRGVNCRTIVRNRFGKIEAYLWLR